MDPRFTAGFKLLSKFQNQWTQIHSQSEKNTSKARHVLVEIDQLDKAFGERQTALDELKNSHKFLVKIQDQIDCLTTDICALEGCFEKIEDYLTVLKSKKESSDTEVYIEKLKIEYEHLAAEHNEASQMRKNNLKSEHLARVDEFDEEQQREFEERRHVLEKAFEEEKTLYMRKTLM